MTWENVDYLDEYNVNCTQLFNRKKNELLVVTEEGVGDVEFVHLKVTPEYDEHNNLTYIEDVEDITRIAYTDDKYDHTENIIRAYNELVFRLLEKQK